MNDDLLYRSTDLTPSSGPDPMVIVWIVLGIAVAIACVVIIAKIRKRFGRPDMHGMSREQIAARWEEIEKTGQSSTMGAKMAIMEADKLLDSALKSMMMSGDTLGERLKFAGYKYPELRKVWDAHRLRNRIVHEASFEPGLGETRAALRDFKRALQVLKLL
jgi:hypothetical protein